jgi:hypothetical protein
VLIKNQGEQAAVGGEEVEARSGSCFVIRASRSKTAKRSRFRTEAFSTARAPTCVPASSLVARAFVEESRLTEPCLSASYPERSWPCSPRRHIWTLCYEHTSATRCSETVKMKYTVYDRLLRREVGQQRRKYTDVRGIYGDRQWINDLDIVNELEGHNGCVNALRYSCPFCNHTAANTIQLVHLWTAPSLGLRRPPHQHPCLSSRVIHVPIQPHNVYTDGPSEEHLLREVHALFERPHYRIGYR